MFSPIVKKALVAQRWSQLMLKLAERTSVKYIHVSEIIEAINIYHMVKRRLMEYKRYTQNLMCIKEG